MRRQVVKICSYLFIAILIIILIVNYFNRQSTALPDMGGVKKGDKSGSPFRWNMDNPDEIESYSDSVKDFYLKDGKAFILFNEILYLAPQQKGKLIDIERFPNITMSFYSKKSALLIIRFFAETDDRKSVDLVSENILVHTGWNRLSLNFRDLSFYAKKQDSEYKYDLTNQKIMVSQLRVDFLSNTPNDCFMILDFIRLNQAGRLDLSASDFNIWGDGRNVSEAGTYIGPHLEQNDGSLPMEISVSPIGFDPSVRNLYVVIHPKKKNQQIALFYRLYDMLNDPAVSEPDAREWVGATMTDESAEINTDGASMVELSFFFPPGAVNEIAGIEKIQVFFERDIYAEQYYPFHGLMTAPYASGSRYETETLRFPAIGYGVSDLKPDAKSFEEINISLAKGNLVIGSIDGDQSKSSIQETVNLFKDMVSVWAVRSKAGSYEDLKKTIEEFEPDAQVINLNNKHSFIYNENKRDLKEQLKRLPQSFVKLDRGPVFFTGVVLISSLIILVLRKKLGIGFTFKASHLKWFGYCLIASVVLLVPLVFILGLGSYRYIRVEEILDAVYRYGISAFLQELMRAVAIEYTVLLAFKRSKDKNKKYLIALLVTSFFFSLGHLGYPGLDLSKGLSFLLVTFIAGLIFGMLYIKTRSVLPVSVLHFISNLFLFVFTTM